MRSVVRIHFSLLDPAVVGGMNIERQELHIFNSNYILLLDIIEIHLSEHLINRSINV